MAPPIIYNSTYPSLHIPTDLSVHQFLLAYNPDDVLDDKVIIEDLDPAGGRLTYGGLRRDSAIAAGGLVKRFGLKAGDAVVIFAPNSVDYVLAAHSIMWFGGIVVGVNQLASVFELKHYFKIANAKLILADPMLRARAEEALSDTDIVSRPALIEIGGSSAGSFPSDFPKGASTAIDPFDLSAKDNQQYPAAVVFSSGTSGKPKGVHLSHYNLIAHMLNNRSAAPEVSNSESREVFYAPFVHMFGLLGAVMVPAFIGNYLVAMKQFQYQAWIEACSRIRATMMRMVPPTALAIAKDPNLENIDLKSVNVIQCAGATLQTEVVQRLQYLLKGVSIVQGYGMSETAVSGLKVFRSVEKSGSVGKLFPSNKLRIVNEKLEDVELGQPGEALIKGPTVFLGYRNDPKGTRETFHEGWLRTGDVLKMDSDGFLWFQDRKKEMIKYKGNQIAPAELEDILGSHADVVEAAVCATFDESQQTEIPIGYVKLKDSVSEENRQAALDRIRQWVDGLVAPYKKMRGGIFYLAEIPKNPTGKIMRSKLPAREEAARRALVKARPARL